MRKLTFLFQLFSKFRENVIWPMKAKSTISAKIFLRETLWGLYIKTDSSAYFWRRDNRFFLKNNYMDSQNLVNLVEFLVKYEIFSLDLITDEKFIPWYYGNTMLPWHYANIMWLWKYYEYVSTKTSNTEM